jgi:hypothetical protein
MVGLHTPWIKSGFHPQKLKYITISLDSNFTLESIETRTTVSIRCLGFGITVEKYRRAEEQLQQEPRR